MKEAADFLKKVAAEGRRVLVLCHHNADPDAAAGVIVLGDLLNELGAKASAGAAEDVSTAARAVLGAFGRDLSVNPPLDFDLVILVDTSSFGHLGNFGEELKKSGKKVAVIDHHKPVEEMKKIAEFYFVRDDLPSESELVFRIMAEMGKKPSPEQASMMLAGVISDTAHFRFSKPETFGVVSSLIEAGADYPRVMETLKQPEDPSKRIAMLKAAGRSEMHKVLGNIVVVSELGSFEGDAASMFVRIGADAAFVGSEDKGAVRLSGRARLDFTERTGVHLGGLMEELAKNFAGSGGGHPGAASLNGRGRFETLKKHLLKALQQKIKQRE